MKQVRCAIYTRKSSEEGLEKAFNLLDAQREACAAYVLSQASEGWSALPDIYDDGGLSGGTLVRPALQRLLAEVQAGRVSLFEMMVRRLAIGQTSRRRSVVPFIKLVVAAAAIPITPGMVIGAEPRDPELHSAKEKLDAAMAGGGDDEIENALTRYTTVLRKRVRIRSTI